MILELNIFYKLLIWNLFFFLLPIQFFIRNALSANTLRVRQGNALMSSQMKKRWQGVSKSLASCLGSPGVFKFKWHASRVPSLIHSHTLTFSSIKCFSQGFYKPIAQIYFQFRTLFIIFSYL